MFSIQRYHDISCGHRVAGHENKCAHLHGHNYRIHFDCIAPELDSLGRVIDFSIVKSALCRWLEDNWDHKFLAWEHDSALRGCVRFFGAEMESSFVWVPFNPTAENIARYLVEVVGPAQLAGTGVTLAACKVDETRKCSATYSKILVAQSVNVQGGVTNASR